MQIATFHSFYRAKLSYNLKIPLRSYFTFKNIIELRTERYAYVCIKKAAEFENQIKLRKSDDVKKKHTFFLFKYYTSVID